MSERSSDPPDARMLFSPVRSVVREPSSDASVPADTSMSTDDGSHDMTTSRRSKPSPSVSVQLLSLSKLQKAKYRPVAERVVESDEEFGRDDVERVVGESEVGRSSYYYVRYADGVVYRVPARSFEHRFPDIVQEFEESQAMGTLPPFNPSSSDVHPSCRQLTRRVKIPGSNSRPTHHDLSPDSYSSDELAQDDDSEEFSDDDASPVKRRSTRTAAATANKKLESSLPFSPKKTRTSTRAIVVHGSDSDGDIQEVPPQTRKSTRARKALRYNLDDEDFEDFTPLDSDHDVRPKAEKKKVVRGKASRPAYGHFRVVADLQLDKEENEDIAPLIAHRAVCEKCHTASTHEQAKKKARKRKPKDDDSEDEEMRLANLGGWVRCLKCPVAAHWGCLARTQREEILRAAHERDKAEWRKDNSSLPEPGKRLGLDTYQTTEFICTSCMRGGICMVCKDIALKPDEFAERAHSTATPSSAMPNDPTASTSARASVQPDADGDGALKELLFRCITCRRLAHYHHMPLPEGFDLDDTTPAELADYYQHSTGWKCADCNSYVYTVEHILAWRAYPENAIEPPRNPNEPPNYKSILPREYLIKWVDRSYRRVQWVSHGWLLAVAPMKLKNFLQGGTKVHLLPEPVSEQQASMPGESKPSDFEIGRDDFEGLGTKDNEEASPLIAYPDAERRIPPAWRTVDRVLDIRLWKPKKPVKSKTRKSRAVTSDDEAVDDDDDDPVAAKMQSAAFDEGEEPPSDAMVTLEEFESLTREKLSEKHTAQVAWAFIKWDDLGYDDVSWDSPPRSDETGWAAYEEAFKRFLFARSVTVPSRGKQGDVARGGVKWLMKKKFTVDNQPNLGQNAQLKLMPFQVDGVNWLCHNWNKAQNCILADEMGLGKTVQIVTFIGYLVSTFKCFPALVVVPNSTITNWVREFERWAPKLRVVPFYGEAKAREIIKRYELSHSRPASGTTGAKYHVLVTTYETVTNTKEFGPVFKTTPVWELLVVDEGQRLKSDASLIFKRLKELRSNHRIIMTGTPLNNNIRELFNLMNFLDPDEWADLEALSKQYDSEELNDELVVDLHTRLKPYFLRRIKSEVLQLPPKNEVIVPISMAPLQKEIYRSVLSKNLEILRSLTESNVTSSKSKMTSANMKNILMQLRKCVQHPYLVSADIEPKGLSPQETHDRLIGASAKLRLLKMMLPKLRARGHRVLLFSQFVIALDIVEDFLVGEGIKYLRLDGSTKQADRQKGMDEFNKKDSDVFIYLLTTRAGGVGINLWSADTVIIFDPDFNPHQDLQAIARAHRYGQQKTVLVFKLMVKDSAEERIMQTGKKKLVLDHLIVQKMDDDNGPREDVQSILMFGAKALFEETEETVAREVHYSEHDIDNLIEKTEKEGDQVEPEANAGSLFAFAKVWSADKEGMEELANEPAEQSEEADAWAKALELIAIRGAAEKEKEQTGRGVRRKAAAVFPQQSIDLGDTPTKDKDKEKGKGKRKKSRGKSAGSDDSDFRAPVSDAASDSDGTEDAAMDADDIVMLPIPGFSSAPPKHPPKHGHSRPRHTEDPHPPLSPIQNRQKTPELPEEFCGLCGERHAPGHCSMTESPENLATYRLILLSHAGDETIEERRAAIRVIDETLARLGKIHLIFGQPLHLVDAPPQPAGPRPPKKPKLDNSQSQAVLPPPRNISNGTEAVAGPSRLNGAAPAAFPATAAASVVPRASNTPNAIAGSSKLPGSVATTSDVRKPKKVRVNNGPACAVCGQVPQHLVKDCPVVALGPSKVNEAILRLGKDPSQELLVDALTSILKKQKRRALAGSATKPDPSNSVIDLTRTES